MTRQRGSFYGFKNVAKLPWAPLRSTPWKLINFAWSDLTWVGRLNTKHFTAKRELWCQKLQANTVRRWKQICIAAREFISHPRSEVGEMKRDLNSQNTFHLIELLQLFMQNWAAPRRYLFIAVLSVSERARRTQNSFPTGATSKLFLLPQNCFQSKLEALTFSIRFPLSFQTSYSISYHRGRQLREGCAVLCEYWRTKNDWR